MKFIASVLSAALLLAANVAHAANNTYRYLVSQTEPLQTRRAQNHLNALGFEGAQFRQDG